LGKTTRSSRGTSNSFCNRFTLLGSGAAKDLFW
jgi:hypothetical protein